jgi:heme-degrading monooxygenase HmoA
VDVFARMHTLETTAEQYEHGLLLILNDLLPWARDSSGFRGMVALVSREHDKSVVLTFWADEQAFQRSFAAGDRLAALAARASGATGRSLEAFEVSIFDVPK